MTLPTDAEVLGRVEGALRDRGRVALCQLLRTEGSTIPVESVGSCSSRRTAG